MKLLYQARRSEIFDLGNGRILKLYNGWVSEAFVIFEFNATNAAFNAGIPCAKAIEIIEKNYRQGIVFELREGIQLRSYLIAHPLQIRRYAMLTATLQASVHEIKSLALRPQKTYLETAIQASQSILKPYWNKITDCSERLTGKRPPVFCHGDFSIENIMLDPNGLVLLDWADAYLGDPASDIARSWIIMHSPENLINRTLWEKTYFTAARNWFYQSYLKEYLRISGISLADCLDWRIPMAAARLKEGVPKEKEWLLHMIKTG